METFLICITAFLASLLTFFSGFGLGTILLPVFALFFPVDLAIGLTGIVHLLNNLFKLILVGKFASKPAILRFGIPAIIAAFFGAQVLILLTNVKPLTGYTLFGNEFFITPVNLTIGLLMILFAIIEVVPKFKKLEFDKNKMIIGGALSGFFGGLSGHQGALRSAFLIKFGLSKEAFIATGVVIAVFVDFTRISVYLSKFLGGNIQSNWMIITLAALSAFLGAYIGNKLLKKITLNFVQIMVVILISVMGILLLMGIIL